MATVCINVIFMFFLKFIRSSYLVPIGYMFGFSLQTIMRSERTSAVLCPFVWTQLLSIWWYDFMSSLFMQVTLLWFCESTFLAIIQVAISFKKMTKINFLKYSSPNFRLFVYLALSTQWEFKLLTLYSVLLELCCEQLPDEEKKATRVRLKLN